MKLPRLAVKRPVTTLMAFLVILLFGIVALSRLPLDILPEMEMPTLTVITVYPGAAAEEVERQVTKPLEAILANAEDLQEITSQSKENVSFIQLSFVWGIDVAAAANNARDLIEMVKRRLPAEAQTPVLFKVGTSMMPVIIYGITAEQNYAGIEHIITEKIAPTIRKTKGVGTLIYLAEPERQINIELDPQRLKAYHLTPNMIATVLKAENLTVPGGSIKIGKQDFALSVPGEFKNVADIENTVITNVNQQLVRLKDVADIKDDYREKEEFAFTQGGRSAALMVQKQTGTNSVRVVQRVREKINQLKGGLPPDVELFELVATDDLVIGALNNLSYTILWAWLFVIAVVFIFLREWKSSLIVFLTMPFALIVAFLCMFLLGWTINMFSLMSLVIAIGMVVDAAIVVLENINSHMAAHHSPHTAAITGASEVGLAITASTATTIAVFLPLIFLGGITGILFKQLAVLVSVTLITALVTALSLTPMVSAQLLRRAYAAEDRSPLSRFSEKIFRAVDRGYHRLLKQTVQHKPITLGLLLLILIFSIFMARNIHTDYLPEFDAGDIMVVFETEVGTRAAETGRVCQQVMRLIESTIPELEKETLFSVAGQTEDGALTTAGFREGKNIGTVICHLVPVEKRKRSAWEIGAALRQEVARIPEIVDFHVSAGNLLTSALMGHVKPIEIELTGNNFENLRATAQEVKTLLQTQPDLTAIQSTLDKGKREVQFQIDRRKAAHLGFNVALIASQIRQSVYGAEAGDLTQAGSAYTIKVRYDPQKVSTFEGLQNIQLTNRQGEQIPVTAVADLTIGTGQLEIRHIGQQRAVKVSADLKEGVALSAAAQAVQRLLKQLPLPADVNLALKGQLAAQTESFADLYLILIIGILLVYMVMAAQFESFKNPLIIMLAVPLTFIGIIWAFLLTGTTLSVMSFIGAIMLMGIVVNNGIVMIDYINQLRQRGQELTTAVLAGARARLRPVLMTSLTTILAMTPLVVSRGMGHEMYAPLGITLIGGLLAATVITLIFIPVVYIIFNKSR